jgi:hypothetical protein
MKRETKKKLWEIWHKLDSDEFEMDYFQKVMTITSDHLKDPIPSEVQDRLFENINSVGAFNNFNVFSDSIDEAYEKID